MSTVIKRKKDNILPPYYLEGLAASFCRHDQAVFSVTSFPPKHRIRYCKNSNRIPVKKCVITCDWRHHTDCSFSSLTSSQLLTRHQVMHIQKIRADTFFMLLQKNTLTFNVKAEGGGDLKDMFFFVR